MMASTDIASTMPSTTTGSSPSIIMPANVLEHLPAEIRHMIYGLLGFPIGTYTWLDCPGPPHCADPSHIIFHEDAKWPMNWHALPGHFQIRKKVEQLAIQKRHGCLTALNVRVKYKMGNEMVPHEAN